MADEFKNQQSGAQAGGGNAGGASGKGDFSAGGGAASWEDALGALVESSPPSGGGTGGAVAKGESSGEVRFDTGAAGGHPQKKKKRRRRKKKADDFAYSKPVGGKTGDGPVSGAAASGASSVSGSHVAQVGMTVDHKEPAGTGGAHPTWEEAMKSMAEDYKVEPPQAKAGEREESATALVDESPLASPVVPEPAFDDVADELIDPWDEPVIAPVEPEPEVKPKPVPKPEPVSEPEPEPEALIESEVVSDSDEDFESIIEEEGGGVTKKHLFIGIGCVSLLIVAGIVGFFWVRGFVADRSSSSEEPPVTESVSDRTEEPVEPSSQEPKEPASVLEKSADSTAGALPSQFFVPGPGPSFTAVTQIGRTVTPEGRFISYVDTLHRMRAVYEADLLQLLDQSLDRRAALDAYFASLQSILREVRTVFDQVSQEQSALSIQFDTVTQQKDAEESAFFAAIEALDGVTADRHLSRFNELIRRQVTVRARHRALSNIRAFLERSSPKIEARIRDIKFNIEPLVKGVKVIDIEQSDLGLIITQ